MNISGVRFFPVVIVTAVCVLAISANTCTAQQINALGVGNWLTITANFPEAGYRRTQFFDPRYNIGVVQWESRLELWLPPFRDKFSWGPYVKLAGIAQSQSVAFPNAWLGGPGVGFQIYPFSSWRFQRRESVMGRLFGPLRIFAEYNFTDYWGPANRWRPRNQARSGFDYWKAVNVNEPGRYWWAEVWNGLYWQSSNEFTDRYDSVIFANSGRFGIRKPRSGAISTITPYLAAESSRTKYNYGGTSHCVFPPSNLAPINPCDFDWENRLLLGGGLRFAPSLIGLSSKNTSWLTRFVIYGEYMNTVTYYGPTAPSWKPRFDIRVGVSASIGDWYK